MPLSLVQAKASTAGAGSLSATFTNPTTAGNLIVVVAAEFYSFTTYSFTVTASDGTNTYLEALKRDNGGGAYSPSIRVLYAENAASVSTITCNDGPGQYDFSILEIGGVATSSSLDQAGGYHADPSSLSYSSGNITTTQADEILLGIHLMNNTGNFTATASGSWTKAIQNTTNTPSHVVQYQIVSSIGTYSSTGSWNTGTLNNDSVIISFKAAGGGGPAFIAQQIKPILQAVNRASTY